MLRSILAALALAVALVSAGTASAQIANIEHVLGDRALLTLQVPTYISPTTGDPDAIEPYYDNAGRVVRLATVAGTTFRLSPATALENFNQAEYDAALERYPSVRDCLIEQERDKPQPNLAWFDWENMPNHGAAYACFVLIFTSYDTAFDVMWWMTQQRMEVVRRYAKYRVGGPADHITDLERSEDFGLRLDGWLPEVPYGGPKSIWPFSLFEDRDYVLQLSSQRNVDWFRSASPRRD